MGTFSVLFLKQQCKWDFQARVGPWMRVWCEEWLVCMQVCSSLQQDSSQVPKVLSSEGTGAAAHTECWQVGRDPMTATHSLTWSRRKYQWPFRVAVWGPDLSWGSGGWGGRGGRMMMHSLDKRLYGRRPSWRQKAPAQTKGGHLEPGLWECLKWLQILDNIFFPLFPYQHPCSHTSNEVWRVILRHK